MGNKNRSSYRFRAAAKITLISVSYLALAAASANEAYAQEPSPPTQTAPQPPSTPAQAAPQSPSPPAQPSPANEPASPPAAPAQESSSPQSAPSSPPAQTPAQQPLPQVNVEAAQPKPRSTSPVRSAQLTAPRPIVPPPSTLDPNAVVQAAWPVSGTQDARTGTVGVFSNSTSVATKINTPIVNIPQSLSVVTPGVHRGQRLSEPHRRHALRPGGRHPPGRRQPRRARHPRRGLERELLRERLPRRRPIFP